MAVTGSGEGAGVPGGDAATGVRLRPGTAADLDPVNRIIERAVMTWDLPERVKRLSLPVYRYDAADLDVLALVVAEDADGAIAGLAAWAPAAAQETPGGRPGLLLHGLYVDPDRQGHGVGGRLLAAAEGAASDQGLQGVLVKAQPGAEDFFVGRGFRELAVRDPARDYPHRFWKPLAP